MPLLQGWDEGVAQMSKGERAILKIASDYAYGSQGVGGVSFLCICLTCHLTRCFVTALRGELACVHSVCLPLLHVLLYCSNFGEERKVDALPTLLRAGTDPSQLR